ncbi:10299_t:CDS:10 [Paraglomus brasilianum]|uniref:Succinate dehydrogenase assembly factor 2, mitochondrial n=1 Tax=Paraglomus brasilianum TaxID=144538 RepID=A0A9N9C5T2_9GLOM|nr:10299_t:CDS:10 [Paraglomus brasilianum]
MDYVKVVQKTSGLVIFPVKNGIIGLLRDIGNIPETLRILLVGVHGWGPIYSNSARTSDELLRRARIEFKNYVPNAIFYEHVISSDGTVSQRVEDAWESMQSKKDGAFKRCDIVCLLGHSQGCVVSMLLLDRLVQNHWLVDKTFGLISFAGVHQGTYEPRTVITKMPRAATAELWHLSDETDETAKMYREAVKRVLHSGGRIVAFHSYGDQVVCLSSSTMNDIVLNHENLAIGLYIPQSFASNYPKDLLASMAALYCKGRNVGLQWDRNLGRVLKETESLSRLAFLKYPVDLIRQALTTTKPTVDVNMIHSEIYGCSQIYGLISQEIPAKRISGLCQIYRYQHTSNTGAEIPQKSTSQSHQNIIDQDVSGPAILPIPRINEGIEKKRARLVYQSRKRGILETDLILSTFADKYLYEFSEEELAEYDQLLDVPDWDIYYFVTNKKSVPEPLAKSGVFQKLKEHVKNEGKIILRMPDLR